MGIFDKRPLCLSLFAFFCALLSGVFLKAKTGVLAAAAALVLAAAVLFFALYKKRTPQTVFAVCGALLLSCLGFLSSYLYFGVKCARVEALCGKDTEIEIIARADEHTYYSSYANYYNISVREIDGQKIKTKLRLECPGDCIIPEGEVFSMSVTLAFMSEDINGFPEKQYYSSLGFTANAVNENGNYISLGNGKPFILRLNSLRRSLGERIGKNTDSETAAMVNTLLLGNWDSFDPLLKRDFIRAGVSHVLVVSGMHLTVLIGGAEYLLRLFRVNKRLRFALLIPLTVFYTVIAGLSASVLRAAIMSLFAYTAYFFGRERDGATSLFLAAALICAVSPYSITSCSLWLSFFSTLGLLLLSEAAPGITEKLKKSKNILIKLLAAAALQLFSTLAAMFAAFPVLWLFFGEISLAAPLSNIICGPLSEILLCISPFLLLPGGFSLPGKAASLVCRAMTAAVEALSSVKGVLISLNYDFAPYIVAAFTLASALFLVIKVKRKWLYLIIPASAAAAFAICISVSAAAASEGISAAYASRKSSDFVIVSDAGECAVLDMSDGAKVNLNLAAFAVKKLNATEIDYLILTHYHSRYLNGVSGAAQRILIRKLLLPEPEKENGEQSAMALQIEDSALAAGISVMYYTPGEEAIIEVGRCIVTVYPPEYIARSVQPVVCAAIEKSGATEKSGAIEKSDSIEKNGLRLLYAGAALSETKSLSERFESLLPGTQAFIIGIHGPLYKKDYNYDLPPGLQYLVFSQSSKACSGLPMRKFASDNGASILVAGEDDPVRVLFITENSFKH